MQVARKLADHGIAAFVLKYPLIRTPPDEAGARRAVMKLLLPEFRQPNGIASIRNEESTAEVLAALAMVRGVQGSGGLIGRAWGCWASLPVRWRQ